MKLTRWGILGCGNIAHKFAAGLQSVPDARLVAIGSRTREKAESFGAQYGVPHRHAGYAALAADPDVDAVYVATPHPMHAEDSLLCLSSGKAVLCEKPFTINTAQAMKVVESARASGLFLMEAMWTRYVPAMARVRELIAEGAIGEPRMVQADFGFRADLDPTTRLFDPALAGGSLLDVGVYCVSLAHMIFGTPNKTTGLAEIGSSGVDEQCGITLGFPGGQLAILSASIRADTSQEAWIWGTEGRIKIHSPFWVPDTLTLERAGQDAQTIIVPYDGNGYNYEAAEVAACLLAGKLESAVLPLDETIAIMHTLDALRAEWGLTYPME